MMVVREEDGEWEKVVRKGRRRERSLGEGRRQSRGGRGGGEKEGVRERGRGWMGGVAVVSRTKSK